jgi:beta-lactamase superfamily II metal-dependent hydrolase
MLIDTGDGNRENTQMIINHIRSYGYNRIDYLVATHADADHIGGMIDIINEFGNTGIGLIFMPDVLHNTRTFDDTLEIIESMGKNIHAPKPGETFYIGTVTATAFVPRVFSGSDINNSSIVLKIEFGNHSFLFMGDAEKELEKAIMTDGYDVSAYVLKVGHHGSNTSTSEQFLRAVAPRYAVISVGKNNHGHPDSSVINLLERRVRGVRNIIYYRTDVHGTIEMSTNGLTLNIKTEKNVRGLPR